MLTIDDLSYRTVIPTTNRVSEGLVADYYFDEGADPDTVYDLTGSPYNLMVGTPANVSWETVGTYGPHMTITDECEVKNLAPMAKFDGSTGEFTVEAWIHPDAIDLYGPARIVNMSDPTDPTFARNFMLAMNRGTQSTTGRIMTRLRTDETDFQGEPELETGTSALDTATLHHVVYTYSETNGERLYVNEVAGAFGGVYLSSTVKQDPLNTWGSFGLMLFTEHDNIGDAPQRVFTGDVYRISLYDRELTLQEVEQNFHALPDGSGTLPDPELSWSQPSLNINAWDPETAATILGTAPFTSSEDVDLVLEANSHLSFTPWPTQTLLTTLAFEGSSQEVTVYCKDLISPAAGESVLCDIQAAGGGEYTLGSPQIQFIVAENNVAPEIGWATSASSVPNTASVSLLLLGSLAYESTVGITVAVHGDTTMDPADYTLPAAPTMPINGQLIGYVVEFEGTAGDGETLKLEITTTTDGTIGTALHEITISASAGEMPGPSNTGPTNLGALVDMGGANITATANGETIENVKTTGQISDGGFDNVTIQNFQALKSASITSGYALQLTGSGSVAQDGEITGGKNCANIYNGNTIRRLNIHDPGADGIKDRGGITVEDCWVHHIGKGAQLGNPLVHADGAQNRNDSTGSVYRRVHMDLPYPGSPGADYTASEYRSNACMIVQAKDGNIANVLIEDCWLNGGNFTIYMTAPVPEYSNTGAIIRNNFFGRDNANYAGTESQIISKFLAAGGATGMTVEGNKFMDTLALIPGFND